MSNTPEKYTRAWYDMMVKIWRDRLDLMGAYDTGALRGSVKAGGFRASGGEMQALYHFLEYGLYVDAGTGNGYKKGNGGDLAFLAKGNKGRGKTTRSGHRQSRPWFSVSWRISREVLKDHLTRILGDEFVGAFSEITK